MSKIIAIHQPNYIPWLGFFYKIHQADTFVFLDDVQYSNKGMHDFHYIKTPQGRFRLKMPVKVSFGDNINQVVINNSIFWRESHLKQLESNYKKAPYFKDVYQDIAELFSVNVDNMSVLNKMIIKFIAEKFGISTVFISSSELDITNKDKNERIFEICQKVDASVYYSGTGASVYQNESDFIGKGIELKYSTFKPFIYPQFWGNFEPNVSVVDYLMNCGYDLDRVLQSQT